MSLILCLNCSLNCTYLIVNIYDNYEVYDVGLTHYKFNLHNFATNICRVEHFWISHSCGQILGPVLLVKWDVI